MKDPSRTNQELLEEISLLKQRIQELEKFEAEGKLLVEALRESEERYRFLFDAVPVGIAISDSEGTMHGANRSIQEITGYTLEEFKTIKSSDTYADLEERTQMLQVLRESGQVRNYEAKVKRKDGTVHPVLLNIDQIKMEGQRVLLTAMQDITERKQIEEYLEKEQQDLKLMIDSSPIIVFYKDEEGRFLRVNKAFSEALEMPEEDFMGKTVFNFYSPEIAQGMTDDDHEVLKSGRPKVNIIERYESAGGIRWVQTDKIPIFDKNGIPLGLIGFAQDITDRKQAEDTLRENEEKLQAIFDTVGTGIIIIDKDTLIIIEANPTAIEMTGLPKDKITGKICHLLVCPAQEGKCPVKDLGQSVDHSERKLLCADGTIKDILKTVYPITIKGRDCYLESFIDISDRKQAEEEKQILEERLNRAEKMEALGILAGGVAHDLNNVLGIVVGYAEMLLMDVDKSSPLRHSLENIMNGGQKAAAIVGDLLTLARRGITDRTILNLNKIITDNRKSPEFANLSFHHPAVKIKTDLEPNLLNISGSSVHLGKTLFNLVSNASEAMPKGGILTVRTANQYLDRPIQGYDQIREGDYVILSVSDTGEGIQEDDLKRVFEPFYTKKVMGRSGTGLGLAVVWGTMKDHNGYINVESEEGKGSTFTLYFPVARGDISSESVAVSISEYMGRGESILVVDDIKGQRDLAAEMLRKLNYTVTSVSSGEEAVAYLKEHTVDLVVLDMIMDPGMDGLDTYKEVLEIRPGQKAIIVSGFSESDRVHAAQALGAGAYVRKPYVIEKLGLATRRELERST